MVDSIEIRLDQLTEAIKGLYAKSSMSQGEIYNALTSLSQRYENLTQITSEKIATTLVNEFRKTIDVKYGQTNQLVRSLEESLKTFIGNQNTHNPKLASEITKLLNDTSATFAKLSSQDLALQKIFNTVELQKNDETLLQISKLNDNFISFSRGFENITITLNKNFADFLAQIKQTSSKEEYMSIKSDLDTITGNVNSVISAISIIDTKYKDLTGLIDALQHRESTFNDAIREIRALTSTINSLQNNTGLNVTKDEILSIKEELRKNVENVKLEIQKITLSATSDGTLKNDVQLLTNSVNSQVENLSTKFNSTKDEVQTLSNNIQGLGEELRNVHNLINDEILYKSHQHQEEYEKYLNNAKEDMRTLLVGLTEFKRDLSAINSGNIKILQEPIVKAMEELKNHDIGKNIKDLSDNLRDVTLEIQSSIQNMQTCLNDLNSVSSMQILTKISEAVPSIADKLEIFRTHVVSENSANLGQIRNSFNEVVATLQSNLKDTIDKIQDDTKTINIETLDTLKVDLQKLSDNLIENVESINERIQKDFINFKVDFQEFALKQTDESDKISDKLSALEIGLENFSHDAIEKINNTINANDAHSQDVLTEIKSDILEGISNIDKQNKSTIAQFELKLDRLLDSYIGVDLDNIIEKKSLREAVNDIDTKIDRTNLQQIHNAKELLEEIQHTTSSLSMKIATIEESKNIATIMNAISKISEKLQSLEEGNSELSENFQSAKEEVEQKLKDNIQKISILVDKTNEAKEENKQNNNIDDLSAKVQEYLSNFEYLKSNISQEIKENLESEFKKIDSSINRIRTLDENTNYSYTLEDIESDFAKLKISIEKNATNNEEIKSIFERIIELKTVGLENIKIDRDIENAIGHLSGWLKDATTKLDDMSERIEDIEKNGFEDIKTRLVQSEKSKKNILEFNSKVENALKVLIRNSQNQDNKVSELNRKLELLSQTQNESFNPNQFIDIFYENMTQTKMLSNRVEIIENKISSIQTAVEKIIGYIEQ